MNGINHVPSFKVYNSVVLDTSYTDNLGPSPCILEGCYIQSTAVEPQLGNSTELHPSRVPALQALTRREWRSTFGGPRLCTFRMACRVSTSATLCSHDWTSHTMKLNFHPARQLYFPRLILTTSPKLQLSNCMAGLSCHLGHVIDIRGLREWQRHSGHWGSSKGTRSMGSLQHTT